MKIFKNQFDNKKDSKIPRGVALGNFDGIHKGHSQLIQTLVKECRNRNIKACVYTFENHPNNVIFKDKHTPVIMTAEQKIKISEELGIDELFLEHFDENYASTTPDDFIKNILIEKLGVKLVVVGFDYSYGQFGKGNVQELKKKGEEYGFDVIVIPQIKSFLPREKKEVTVSSTVLRELIRNGNMIDYKVLTGRNYFIPGKVQCGRKVGKKLGFPTANIVPQDGFALPEFGVYATVTHIGDKVYRSITNIGNNPTFKEIKRITVETYLIGFEGELYGQDIEVEFIQKMRGEIAFSSVEDLVAQINSDLKERKEMSEGIQKVYEKNGVEIFYIPTDKFKTSIIKVLFCDNLSKETAYKNCLLANVLSAATKNHPSRRSISQKNLELYGANIFGSIFSKEEVQVCEFRAEYTDKKYLSDAPETENEIIDFLFEMIFNPLTEECDGQTGFSKDVFQIERENQNINIKSIINNKNRYAMMRINQIMYENEPLSVGCAGKVEDGDNLTPVMLFDYYKNIFLKNLPVKIIFSGSEYPEKLTEYTTKYFAETSKIKLNEAYVERLSIKPEEVKSAEEKQDVTQGILVMGYRTNTHPLSEDYYATLVCTAILGQSPNSKLFVNVREKNSLAYDVYAFNSRVKGSMNVICGIDAANKDIVVDIINKQLEAIKNGEISKEEIDDTVKMLCDDLYSHNDHQEQMMSYYFNQYIMGQITDILEYIEKIKAVKAEDIVAAAKKIQLDTIYFLKGEDD